MWLLNFIIGNSGRINTLEFKSLHECVAYLSENGLLPSFVSEEYLWWVVEPGGKVLVR